MLPALFACFAAGGYFIVRTAMPEKTKSSADGEPAPVSLGVPHDDPAPVFRSERPENLLKPDNDALEAGAIAGRRTITFSSREAMEKFLDKIKGGAFSVLGRIDKLNTLSLGFLDPAALAALLDGSEEVGMVFPVYVPDLPDGSVQPGALGVGGYLNQLLGINGDNSTWGKGVTIAVLDTGVNPSMLFNGKVSQISLIGLPSDMSQLNGHGTALISLAAGDGSSIPGIAPDANYLSIRLADDSGSSNSFLIAQGIIAAVDAGAQIINISLGGYGQGSIVQQAVDYANAHGAVIFASAGNNGLDYLAQPAALTGVISVGANDAKNDHMAFSNTGSELSLSTYGYAINAATPDGNLTYFSGTSPASVIAAAAAAAAMSNNSLAPMNANQAVTSLNNNLNESGAPGSDASYGGGTIDLGRVMSSNTPGITDVALASQYVNGNTLQVTVQNQGTTSISNAAVQINTPSGNTTAYVSSLAPNQIQTINVPISNAGDPLTFQSSVTLSGGQTDSRPNNNRRTDVYTPVSAY